MSPPRNLNSKDSSHGMATAKEARGQSVTSLNSVRENIRGKRSLFQAMSCPVCHRAYKDPVQLQCGHSLCRECLNGSMVYGCQDGALVYTCYECPRCRKRVPVSPTRNSISKEIIKRIKKHEMVVSRCINCFVCLKFEEQFACDDCYRLNKEEGVRCSTCIVNHAKRTGHVITPVEESRDNVRAAVAEVDTLAKRSIYCVEACCNIMSQHFPKVEDLVKTVMDYYCRFNDIRTALTNCEHISKKDTAEFVENAHRIYEIFEQSANEILEYVADFADHSALLSEKAKKRLREIDESLVIPVKDENVEGGSAVEWPDQIKRTPNSAVYSGYQQPNDPNMLQSFFEPNTSELVCYKFETTIRDEPVIGEGRQFVDLFKHLFVRTMD